jgi:undecaprenyl-diphosphatase
MIDSLAQIDQSLLLWLNGFHNSYWDVFMYVFSGKWIWIPMYVAILYVLIRNYSWKIVLIYSITIVLTIVFADQICATLIRPMVCRLRPSFPDNPISGIVHIVNGYHGGHYGFPSCHSANSFALATIVFLLFRNRRLTTFIFSWAFINSCTRIYLGVHYPGDLLVGAIIGSAISVLVYYFFRRFTKDQRLESYKQIDTICYVGLFIIAGIFVVSFIIPGFSA